MFWAWHSRRTAKLLASGSENATIGLWEVPGRRPLATLGVASSADRRRLASGSEYGTIRLWETSGACLRTLPIDPRYERTSRA
jgi:WD40 repeat protein